MKDQNPHIKNNLSFSLSLEYGISQNNATITWLERAIAKIEETLSFK